jgi:hypothetical protein
MVNLHFLYNHTGNRIYRKDQLYGCNNSVKRIFFISKKLSGA